MVPWQRVISARLRCRHADLDSSEATKTAELGLEYPRSAYWFVLRAAKAFGRVAVLWELSDGGLTGLSQEDASAVPFDTGGLWMGKVKCDPEFTDASDRKSFTYQHAHGGAFESAFATWAEEGYASARDYVDGRPPIKHVPRIIRHGKINSSHAWSWEMRIRSDKIESIAMQPSKIFWTPKNAELFLEFAENDETMPRSERVRTGRLAENIGEITQNPTARLKAHLYDLLP